MYWCKNIYGRRLNYDEGIKYDEGIFWLVMYRCTSQSFTNSITLSPDAAGNWMESKNIQVGNLVHDSYSRFIHPSTNHPAIQVINAMKKYAFNRWESIAFYRITALNQFCRMYYQSSLNSRNILDHLLHLSVLLQLLLLIIYVHEINVSGERSK